MNNGQKSLSINETFIIESIESSDVMSACTGFYTNTLISCTGNTQILLSNNIIKANSAFSATTFYGDGSNLIGISKQDTFVTGGTYNSNSGIATFTNNTGGTFSVNGFYTGSTDIYITGVTFSDNLLSLYRNDGVILGASINSFTSLTVNGTVIFDGTVLNTPLILSANDVVNIKVTKNYLATGEFKLIGTTPVT